MRRSVQEDRRTEAPGDVLRMILGQGLRTIFIGVAIGIAGSLALTRTVESTTIASQKSRSRRLRQ